MATCADQCNAPEINCISFIGASKPGPDGDRLGFAVRVGGGLSSTPRIARDLGVFVPQGEALEVARAILDVWRHDLKYRLSRAKARLKFLVDDYGVEGVRKAVEEQLGRTLEDLRGAGSGRRADRPPGRPSRRSSPAWSTSAFPVFAGQVNGEQTIADRRPGGLVRRRHPPGPPAELHPDRRARRARATRSSRGWRRSAFDLDVHQLRGTSVGCTGQPLCNYAVAETKTKMQEIVERLEDALRHGRRRAEARRRRLPARLRPPLDHRHRPAGHDGARRRRHASWRRTRSTCAAAWARTPTIGRPLLRRVPADEAADVVERLVAGWLEHARTRRDVPGFADRTADEDLIALARGADAVAAREGGH